MMAQTSRVVSRQWMGRMAVLAAVVGVAMLLVNCNGNVRLELTSNPPTGSARVSISDPPKCRFPNGEFRHVYVTIRSVQAHVSTLATESSAGWQELATQLVQQPIQVDLLALPTNGCTLATLGSNPALPTGDYQQIRLLLVSNNPGLNDPRPASNACGSAGFNCVVLSDNSIHPLDLSSQANTGLKVPPGQVLGGPIRVTEGSAVDLNIDVNTCASIVPLPGNRFRLRPTLTAGQVGTTPSTAISGQVVDQGTMQAISGGTVLVALEQADSTGTDRIIMETAASTGGNFSFCPVPPGMYDLVAVGTGSGNRAYNATVLLNVMPGTGVGKIPLVAEGGATPAGPATIQGTVTASSGTAPSTTGASVDVGMSAFQTITLPGGSTTRNITIPLQADSTLSVATAAGMSCPTGTNCANHKLVVPASNPSVGVFSASGTTFSTPATGDVLFKVEGRATAPMTSTPICTPAVQLTDKDSADMPLKVTGGATTTAKRLDFTGCT